MFVGCKQSVYPYPHCPSPPPLETFFFFLKIEHRRQPVSRSSHAVHNKVREIDVLQVTKAGQRGSTDEVGAVGEINRLDVLVGHKQVLQCLHTLGANLVVSQVDLLDTLIIMQSVKEGLGTSIANLVFALKKKHRVNLSQKKGGGGGR